MLSKHRSAFYASFQYLLGEYSSISDGGIRGFGNNISLCHTEGEHGEVVVLFGTVTEAVGIGFKGLDNIMCTVRGV